MLLTPGPVQRDLLRARLPRALPRLHARRGRRPDRARRPRLPQDGRRARAASTPSCAGSTTTSAIRSSCAPTRRSACPASCRRGAPATCSSRTRSASGVLESPALLGVPAGDLPSACSASRSSCRRVATWWCGEAAALDDARRRLRRAGDQAGVPRRAHGAGLRWRDLDAAGARAAGRRACARAPERYVVEEFLPLSHAPVWHDGRLESRALMLRVFLVADGRGDYRVMPGGLSRIAGDDRHVVSSQRGGSSKDTWVLSDAPIEPSRSCPGRSRPEDIARSAARGVEPRRREPVLARALRRAQRERRAAAARGALAACPTTDACHRRSSSPAVVRTCRAPGAAPRRRPSAYARRAAPARARPDRRTCSTGRTGRSLAFNVEQTVRVAGAVRDRLSRGQLARLLNRLCEAFARARAPPAGLADALELIDRRHRVAGGRRRARDGAHDARRRLALPEPRAPLERLLFVATTLGDVARRATGERSGAARMAARAVRQRHHLSRPLHAAARSGWRSSTCCCSTSATRARRAFQLAKLAKHVRLLPERRPRATLIAEIDEAAGDVPRRRAGDRRPAAPARPRSSDFLRRCRAPRAAPVGRAHAALLQPRLRAAAGHGGALTRPR